MRLSKLMELVPASDEFLADTVGCAARLGSVEMENGGMDIRIDTLRNCIEINGRKLTFELLEGLVGSRPGSVFQIAPSESADALTIVQWDLRKIADLAGRLPAWPAKI